MACHLKRAVSKNGELVFESYSCEQVRFLKDKWLSDFRRENGSDSMKRDPQYERIKESLDEFLSKCRCGNMDKVEQETEDYLKCKKCPDKEHEGQFCRCEGRNIRIAKEMRLKGNAFKREKPLGKEVNGKMCKMWD